jgi:hypothetical protein
MKKFKVMLMSLALIAVVSGALAFKAKTRAFCVLQTTGTTCSTSDDCTTRLTGKKTTTGSGTKYCTTTDDGSCSSAKCSSAAPVTLINNP